MNPRLIEYLSGNVPGGLWSLLVLLLITWFIIWYVYHYSTLLSKKRFFRWGMSVSSLWIGLYLLSWFLFPPPKKHTRILITFSDPPSISQSFGQLYALGFNVYSLLSVNLPPDHFLVYHPDWLVQLRPLSRAVDSNITNELLNYMHADYAVILSSTDSKQYFRGIVYAVDSPPDTLLNARYELSSKGISTLTNTVLSLVNIGPKKCEISISGTSVEWASPIWSTYALGRLSWLHQRLSDARSYFQDCLREAPDFSPARLGMATLELDSARIIKANGGFFQDHLALANSYLYSLKENQALTAEAYRVWGEYAILSENFVLAEEKLKASYQLNPNSDQLYVDFSRLHPSRYRDLGFFNEESLYKRALFINPASLATRIWYADYLHRHNRMNEAFALYRKFLLLFPAQFDLQIALGKLYITARKYDRARSLFLQLRELYPSRSDLVDYNLAVAIYHQGDTLSARRIFEQLARKRRNPDVYLYLAEIAEAKGDLDLAIRYLRRRIRENRGQNDPFKEEARKHLVLLLKKKGVLPR